jgi:hypothetical protein
VATTPASGPSLQGRGRRASRTTRHRCGWLSDAGRESKERIESLTDVLAAPTYDSLTPDELDELIAKLKPLSAALDAAGSR